MTIYRLASGDYINDLSGTGSKLYGGRWNTPGLHAVYCTENISLAVLEILVHVQKFRMPFDYHLLSLEIPDTIKPKQIHAAKLKKNWKDDTGYTQFMGDSFLKSREYLFLKVPSAIVEPENNFIINPAHPDASRIKIISTMHFEFDKRLQLTNE